MSKIEPTIYNLGRSSVAEWNQINEKCKTKKNPKKTCCDETRPPWPFITEAPVFLRSYHIGTQSVRISAGKFAEILWRRISSAHWVHRLQWQTALWVYPIALLFPICCLWYAVDVSAGQQVSTPSFHLQLILQVHALKRHSAAASAIVYMTFLHYEVVCKRASWLISICKLNNGTRRWYYALLQ